jgi:hypothetical protein
MWQALPFATCSFAPSFIYDKNILSESFRYVLCSITFSNATCILEGFPFPIIGLLFLLADLIASSLWASPEIQDIDY